MKMHFNSLIPELSVRDIEKSKDFYLKIGFTIKYQREKFYFLELEENQLMIEEINDHWNVGDLEYPFGRGINLSMSVSDIDALYQKLKAQNFVFFKELMCNTYQVEEELYEDKEFLIQDPDGYLLRFTN